MGPYSPYNEKSSKDNLREEFDSSTACGSETPVDDNGEADSFLPFTRSLGRIPQTRPLYVRFLSSPLFAIMALFTIISLLGMNIATIVILRRQSGSVLYSAREGQGHDHPHDAMGDEAINEKGLRIAPNGKLLECGEKAEDAKANGCIFDVMSFEWTPPACYDEEILEETTDPNSILAPSIAGNFPWYRWANFTEPLEQKPDVLSAYAYVWTNQDWHRGHCMYMWRVLVKAENQVLNGEKNVYVPAGATNHGHIAHCNLLISDKVDGSIIPLEAFRTVTSCVRLDKPEAGKKLSLSDFGG